LLDVKSSIFFLVSYFVNYIISLFKFLGTIFNKNRTKEKGKGGIYINFAKVLGYIFVSFVVKSLFISLLIGADQIFKSNIDSFIKLLNLNDLMARFIVGLLLSPVFGGFFTLIINSNILGLLRITKEKLRARWHKLNKNSFIRGFDTYLSFIILLPIVCIFGLSVLIQFKYLFVGNNIDISNILENFSYADYARRGFNELLMAAALAYPLLAWATNRAKIKKLPLRYSLYFMTSLIFCFVFVMLFSAWKRIGLYENFYGISLNRLYTRIAIISISILFTVYQIISTLRVISPKIVCVKAKLFGDFSLIAAAVAIAFLGIVALIPFERIIALQMLIKYRRTGKIDALYLRQLSSEVDKDLYNFYKNYNVDNTLRIIFESKVILDA